MVALNVTTYTLEILGQSKRYLHDLGIGKDFVNRTLKTTNHKGIKLISYTTLKLRIGEKAKGKDKP